MLHPTASLQAELVMLRRKGRLRCRVTGTTLWHSHPLTSHMILTWVTLRRAPEALLAPAEGASEPGFGWSVRTDKTKSPGLLRLSRTRKVQGVALTWRSDSAAAPDRCPWYHLEK